MNVLVTGSRGLLGSTIVSIGKEKGVNVIPFEGDITIPDDFKAIDQSVKIDWVIHAAAMTDVNRCEKEPDLCNRVNVDGTQNAIDFAKSIGAKLLFISTVSVFSGTEGDYKESDIPGPVGAYNVSKANAEKIVLEYPQGIVVRINIIGIHKDGSRGKNFLEWAIDSAKQNKDVKIFNDVWMNPLSSVTLAEMLIGMLSKDLSGNRILHLGSINHLSKAEVARMVFAHFPSYSGAITEASVDSLPGPKRPKQMWFNTDTTAQILGVEMPDLASEVEKAIKPALR